MSEDPACWALIIPPVWPSWCRQGSAPGEGQPPWADSGTASSTDLMAAALDEMQVKMSKLELDNARLRVDLVSFSLLGKHHKFPVKVLQKVTFNVSWPKMVIKQP